MKCGSHKYTHTHTHTCPRSLTNSYLKTKQMSVVSLPSNKKNIYKATQVNLISKKQ